MKRSHKRSPLKIKNRVEIYAGQVGVSFVFDHTKDAEKFAHLAVKSTSVTRAVLFDHGFMNDIYRTAAYFATSNGSPRKRKPHPTDLRGRNKQGK